MWTLFGSAGSGSAAVEMALERCGVPYRALRASTWEADSARDELLAANPLGQIPTLQTDEGVLTESAAILIALGLRFPGARLLPADEAGRAQAIRGLVFIAANCYAAIGVIDYPERWCADGGDDGQRQSLRAGARARLHRYWEMFADQFAGDPFLGGAEPGGLDMLAAVVSRWSGTRAHLAAQRPALHATLLRVQADLALAPVFARHWPS